MRGQPEERRFPVPPAPARWRDRGAGAAGPHGRPWGAPGPGCSPARGRHGKTPRLRGWGVLLPGESMEKCRGSAALAAGWKHWPEGRVMGAAEARRCCGHRALSSLSGAAGPPPRETGTVSWAFGAARGGKNLQDCTCWAKTQEHLSPLPFSPLSCPRRYSAVALRLDDRGVCSWWLTTLSSLSIELFLLHEAFEQKFGW